MYLDNLDCRPEQTSTGTILNKEVCVYSTSLKLCQMLVGEAFIWSDEKNGIESSVFVGPEDKPFIGLGGEG